MKKISIALIVIFCLEAAVVLSWFNLNKARVLILHSYNDDYSWVRDVNEGLKRVLKNKTHFSIRWHYLDTKRHPWQEYKENAGVQARRLIDNWQPDVIIAIDDDAQKYVAKHYNNHPKISIVFGGVNNRLEDYDFDKTANVTGLLERLPLTAIKEGLQTFSSEKGTPRPVRLFFIGDASETVVGDERWVRAFDWGPVQLVESRLVDNLDEWKDAVREASGSADYILTSNYRKVSRVKGSKDLVPPKELIEMTVELSKVPVIGSNAFFVEDGGALAIATSPFEHGEVPARMAVQILEDKKGAQQIPVRNSNQFVVAISESKIKRIGFDLPMVYEACARASNYYYK